MDFLQVIFLGLIEGITEFLPISSTAHLILTTNLLNITQTAFVKSFEITIQLGAILAVILLYWKKFFIEKEQLKRVIVAFIPTAVIGLTLYHFFKGFLMDNLLIIILALIIGGIILILFEKNYKEKKVIGDISKISYKHSFIIGLFQSIAIIPGVSRAGATIVGGLWLGLKRKTIIEFSFLLAVPTILAATGYDLLRSGVQFSLDQFELLLLGFIISFIVAILAIKVLLRFIQKNNFVWFGVYRIVIGVILLIILLL